MRTRTAALSPSRVAVSAAFFCQGLVFAAIVTQVPRLQDEFGYGEGTVTTILVLVAVLSGVGSAIAGTVASRRTSAFALTGALAVIAVAAAAIGASPGFAFMVAGFCAYGVGLGAVDACMNMQGVRVQAAEGRSIMGGFHGWWSVGGIVGALYASTSSATDLPLPVSLALIALAVLVIAWRSSPSLVRAREETTAASSGEVAVLPWRPVLIFGTVIALFYAADTGTLTWSSPYLKDALDAPEVIVPLGFAAYQAGALASRFGGDFLVRRRGARWVVAAATTVGLVGLLIVVVTPVPAVAVVGFFVTGLGLAILAPLSFAALSQAVPPRALDVAIARMNIANYLGAIVGGAVIGAAATGGYLRWAFVIPLALVPLVFTTLRAFRRPAATA